ncbi:MAG: M66 family metalloprotease [Gemmatimonadota bacterium]
MPQLIARLSVHSIRRLVRGLPAILLAAAVACQGGEPGDTGTNPPQQVGSLVITIAGLPVGTAAGLTVTGPGGFSRVVDVASTLSGLPPGVYEVAATEVAAATGLFAAAAQTMSATVSAGASATVAISYALSSGSLSIVVSGLPVDAQAAVTVTGPSGFSRTVAATTVLSSLRPGTYTVTAASVSASGHTWTAPGTPATHEVQIGTTPAAASVSYQIASGAIVGSLTGLPIGSSPMLVLTGPGGSNQTVTPGTTVTNLSPGSYTLSGTPVTIGDDTWGVPQPTAVTVAASSTPVTAMVQYALVSGRLTVTVTGLPGAVAAAVVVTGPGGFQRNVGATETLLGLTPGTYTIAASNVVAGAQTWEPSPASQQIAVPASSVPAAAALGYAVNSGSLTVVVNGLSQAIPAAIVVTGPASYSVAVATTTLLSNLKPGTYTVTASNTAAGVHVYAPTPTSQQITVVASPTPATVTVQYSLNSGMLQLAVNGLPPGVPSPITVTGPAGYSASLTGASLLTGLKPGTYTIAASMAQNGSLFWAPNPSSQVVNIVPSISAVTATVNYTTANGGLTVNINGLPVGVNASVLVTGPGGYSQNVTATTTIQGLLQGLYTVAASNAVDGANTWSGTPTTQNVVVGGGVTSSVIITYVLTGGPPPPPPGLNLTIDGMHVQQVVQAYTGTVPLVSGRAGLLRVFVKATAANSATPAVRVRFYDGPTLTSTVTLTAPTGSVPTAVAEGTLNSSWNYSIPTALMQPNLRILADVDPTNTVTESSESDNSFPTSGTPATMDVRSVSTFEVRLVPITQSVNGNTGAVNTGNAAQFMSESVKLFPLGTVDTDVRAAYTTAAPVLQNNDGNGAWSQILSELSALRTADGSSRYYVGVVKVGYTSGIAGLGYVPGRASLTWDYIGSADGVVAHELGHNFGRFHAPCGGAGGADPGYPYPGGLIGVWGYDISAGTLKSPSTVSDLMGYCSNTWISDYTFNAVLAYRAANPFAGSVATAVRANPRRGLLVWGRINSGKIVLEPAYEVDAQPSLPTGAGPHRLQILGPIGETLLDVSFTGQRPADVPDATEEHFSFVVPFETLRGIEPGRIRISTGSRQVERGSRRSSAAVAPVAQRLDAQRVRVTWDSRAAEGVLVRDSRTGEILSFGRGGNVVVRTAGPDVELTLSDGVRSSRQRVHIRP